MNVVHDRITQLLENEALQFVTLTDGASFDLYKGEMQRKKRGSNVIFRLR